MSHFTKDKVEFNAKRWYPVYYAGWWNIQEGPFYGDKELTNEEHFTKEGAARAACLMATSPQMHEALCEIDACIKITTTVAQTQAMAKVRAALKLYNDLKIENIK